MTETRAPGPHLTVSVVLYENPAEEVSRTLDSLRRASLQACAAGQLQRVTVFLVDNSRARPAREAFAAALVRRLEAPQFSLHYRPQARNRGFGSGHNAALAEASGEFHLVLNPDVELDPAALTEGIRMLRARPDVVLLSPRVSSGAGEREFLCKRYPSILVLALRAFAPGFVQRRFSGRLARYEMRDVCSGEQAVAVPIASGCFMLARTSALRSVGGFDDHFFLYFEDFDLSLRLASQGTLLFAPGMRIVHHGGYAARKGLRHLRYFVVSGFRFFRLHGWRWV